MSGFYNEYQRYIQQRDGKHVEWYVTNTGMLNMYIFTDYGYCYTYSVAQNSIPEIINPIISKRGMVLSVSTLDNGVIEVNDKVDKIRDTLTRPYIDPQA